MALSCIRILSVNNNKILEKKIIRKCYIHLDQFTHYTSLCKKIIIYLLVTNIYQTDILLFPWCLRETYEDLKIPRLTDIKSSKHKNLLSYSPSLCEIQAIHSLTRIKLT